MTLTDDYAREAIDALTRSLGSVSLEHFVKERADGPYLMIVASQPSEHLFRALRLAQDELPPENPFKERAAVSKRKKAPADRLSMPEAQLLKSTLSDSLTVNRHTFGDDFFARYTKSVFGFEDQIVSGANYLVYGRRGSGKSSLLAFAMHTCLAREAPFAWIDMQTYAGREDVQVAVDILHEVLTQCRSRAADSSELDAARVVLDEIGQTSSDAQAEKQLRRVLPRVRRALGELAGNAGPLSIFLDDLHVLKQDAQSMVLGHIYAVSRGNQCYLKISGIEQFSKPWDARKKVGLESPHDAQILKLDYNLTMPDKSRDHIQSILDAHARFSGLPSVSFLCGKGALSRLVWVAAAVPRDALNLFAQAMTKAGAQAQKRVSITSINAAASDMAEQKLRDMQQDRADDTELQGVLERIKTFCIVEKKVNAFLIEIRNEDSFFRSIQDLIALRLVHVIHEGITPHEAGRRYQALLLDYGFYVGIRASRSVDLFQSEPKRPTAKELRKLPIISSED